MILQFRRLHFILYLIFSFCLVSISYSASNDNFSSAFSIDGSTGSVTWDNVGATSEDDEPNHAGVAYDSEDDSSSVWWYWEASCSGEMTLDTSGSDFNTVLAVYTGSDIEYLTEVVSNDDCESEQVSCVTFTAEEGVVYRIAVDGYQAAQGNGVLNWNFISSSPPANDNFDDAILLTGISGSTTGNNQCSTAESGEPIHLDKSNGNSVWWYWTAPSSTNMTFSTDGSSFDTLLTVYTGSSVDALTEVGFNDDCDNASGSCVTFAAEKDAVYRIAVDGFKGSAGDIVLNWENVHPSNDNFEDADQIKASTGSATWNNEGATNEAGEPNHAGAAYDAENNSSSVWWYWEAPCSGDMTLDTSGSDFNTVLAVYTGSNVDGLTEVVSNDDCESEPESCVTFAVEDGVIYKIAIDGYQGLEGNGVLNWNFASSSSPPNDNFEDAILIEGISDSTTGSNECSTTESGEPNHAGSSAGHSVWWYWTSSYSGEMTFSTTGSDINTVLAVYTGSSVDDLTEVASSDEQCDEEVSGSCVDFTAEPGVTYRIAVDGDRGNIVLNWSIDFNDDFDDADSINGSTGSVTWNNVGATNEDGEPNHAGAAYDAENNSSSLWWYWEASCSGDMTLNTTGSDFNTVLAVYTGSSVDDLTEVVSNDDCESEPESCVTFAAEEGIVYRIAADGYQGEQGNGVLNWNFVSSSPPPPNDNFADAILLDGISGSTTGNNRCSTAESGEPNHAGSSVGNSVWWYWTSSYSGEITFNTSGSDFDTLLAVYKGSSVDGLTEVASSDDCNGEEGSCVTFEVDASVVYRIAVDGFKGKAGNIDLNWEGNNAPTADAGPDQTVIPGITVTLDGTNSSDAGGSIASYLWTQTGGTTVTLSDATSSQSSFTAPSVSSEETLTFELTVTDNEGLSGTDSVNIHVSDTCSYALSSPSQLFTSSGGTGTISITAPEGCEWTAWESLKWINITSSKSGTGSGVITYTVASTTSTSTVAGTINIADKAFTVTRNGVIHLPDLKAISVSSPDTAKNGKTVTIKTVIKNAGKKNAAASSVQFYLSANNNSSTIDGDTLLATKSVKGLSKKQSRIVKYNWKVNATAGTYYIKVLCDSDNAIDELNENNNIKASNKIKVK
ncbi:MAG: hypothetical protein HZA77_10070 [Candidatus Schekmanbacteria bacterium]|nr:hypothetical protein [Candidatus Schekmanbacteria bacterium]